MPAELPSHLVSKVETRLPFGRSGERGASGGTGGPERRLRRRRPSQVRGFPPPAKRLTAGPGTRVVTRPRGTRRNAPAGGRFTRPPGADRGRRAPHGRRAPTGAGPDRTDGRAYRARAGTAPGGTSARAASLNRTSLPPSRSPSMAPPPPGGGHARPVGPQLTCSRVQLSNLATAPRYGEGRPRGSGRTLSWRAPEEPGRSCRVRRSPLLSWPRAGQAPRPAGSYDNCRRRRP